ncbi:MAG TPA: hypothetical protein VNN79_08480 [Actinomycetota bacterium]|nr:hypothetical protein [Actinomycetota bacterium]
MGMHRGFRIRVRSLAVVGAAFAVIGLVPGTASAAFPGANGRIAWESSKTGEFDIYSARPDGSDRRELTTGFDEDHRPRWSPDGARIVFFRHKGEAGPGNIWVMDADGSNLTRLTNTQAYEQDPSWSADGTQIVFERGSLSQAFNLWVMDADGSNQHRLTHSSKGDIAATWSSTNVIAFTSFRTGHGDLYTIHPDGTHLVRVTSQALPDMYPDWSPNGAKLVFFTENGGATTKREVWTVSANGTQLQQITHNDVDDSFPCWSPNGKLIALQRDVHQDGRDFYDVWTMRTDGTHFQRVTHDGFLDGSPSWQAK